MLLCISGALRRESTNTRLLREAARLYGGEHGFGDLNLPLYDGDLEAAEGIPARVSDLAEAISKAEAVAISSPEYNQSFTGVLKNALDWVSRIKGAPWHNKPVAIMSAAAGRAGGARANYALRLALTPFRPRLLTGPEVLLADSSNAFDDAGHLVNERSAKDLSDLMAALRAEAAR
ncbi:MAG: NAD(P)H-dependent oxidoreductase [Pseudomonadota bacterium]